MDHKIKSPGRTNLNLVRARTAGVSGLIAMTPSIALDRSEAVSWTDCDTFLYECPSELRLLASAPRHRPAGSALVGSCGCGRGLEGDQFVVGVASHRSISRRVVGPLGRAAAGSSPSLRRCAAVVRAPLMGSVARAQAGRVHVEVKEFRAR